MTRSTAAPRTWPRAVVQAAVSLAVAVLALAALHRQCQRDEVRESIDWSRPTPGTDALPGERYRVAVTCTVAPAGA